VQREPHHGETRTECGAFLFCNAKDRERTFTAGKQRMITILRVRFESNTDPTTVWSADTFEKWMQPLIPFSLGDFWWTSSRGLFSLDHRILDPIVIADPRIGVAPDNASQRTALVTGTIQAATAQLTPDWDATDIVMIWYAQRTDTFGGGTTAVPVRAGGTKDITVTVVDIATPFDAACQELGHGFGLKHEVDDAGREYTCSYSVMSARSVNEFLRPADKRLPDGLKINDPRDEFFTKPAGRVVGPSLVAAQLYQYPEFRDTSQVIQLTGHYVQYPAAVTLHALNHSASSANGPLPVLLAFPSNTAENRTFTVELRRGGSGYDKAIGAAVLVVNSINPDGRIRYEGAAPLKVDAATRDWHCKAGNFSLRVRKVGAGNDFAAFSLFGGAAFPVVPTIKQVLAGADGVVYTLMDNGDLLWNRHDGLADGSFRWADAFGRKVGVGWNFRQLMLAEGGVIYAITHTGDLLWFRHDGQADGSFTWADGKARKVGVGWNMKRVFYGGGGVIYAITDAGDLLWYRHDGRTNGSFAWADSTARTVGVGWNMSRIFAAEGGVIYAISDTGDLLWFRHDGRSDGSFTWADSNARKVGTGWNMRDVIPGVNGVIYTISDSGDLSWYRHDGRGDGSFRWADTKARKVGTGWTYSAVLYGVNTNGDLQWYRHDGVGNGTFRWGADDARKVGTGWNMREVFAGDDGVIYAVTHGGELLWSRHDGRGDGSFTWADNNARTVGVGWHMKHVFSGGDGVIYAIARNGDLLWFRHDGRSDGSFRWADSNARKVGVGWSMPQVFSGGGGVIYAVTEGGDLLWFRHDGRGDGSFRWTDNNARKVGTGWKFKQIFSAGHGVIYAVNDANELLWYRHDGRGDGSFRWAAKKGRKVGTGWRSTILLAG